jgi:hypothetical protein
MRISIGIDSTGGDHGVCGGRGMKVLLSPRAGKQIADINEPYKHRIKQLCEN